MGRRTFRERSCTEHPTTSANLLVFVKKYGNHMDNLAAHYQGTVRLLLAFLAFGAACSTLWAWMLAQSGGIRSTPRQ